MTTIDTDVQTIFTKKLKKMTFNDLIDKSKQDFKKKTGYKGDFSPKELTEQFDYSRTLETEDNKIMGVKTTYKPLPESKTNKDMTPASGCGPSKIYN